MDKLYEIWTYCKLVEIVSAFVENQGKTIPKIQIDAFRAILFVGHSKEARVDINSDISICSNWTFATEPTRTYFSPVVTQRPDLVFEVRTQTTLNILDAKYRIDIVVDRDGQPMTLNNADMISRDLSYAQVICRPKDENINTMHRYKDAIRRNGISTQNAYSRAVRIGVILYPHKPNYEETELIRKSIEFIDNFEIGAIPLAPGAPDLNWMSNYTRVEDMIPDDRNIEQVRVFAHVVHRMIQNAIE